MHVNDGSPKLQVQDIHIGFGGLRALQGVSVDVHEGQIVAIIGPNGAGKTTLLNAISGVYHPAPGRILLDGQDRTFLSLSRVARLGISRTFQNVALFRGMSVLDNIMVGRHCHMRAGVLSAGFFWGLAQREEIRHRATVERIIDFLEINHLRKAPVGTLSYEIEARRTGTGARC